MKNSKQSHIMELSIYNIRGEYKVYDVLNVLVYPI